MTPGTRRAGLKFGALVKALSSNLGYPRSEAKAMASQTPQTWRDVAVRAHFGTLWASFDDMLSRNDVELPDGEYSNLPRWLEIGTSVFWNFTTPEWTLGTDVPCHLFAYFQDEWPIFRKYYKLDRGVWIFCGRLWIFTHPTKVEQIEPGETTTHTFILQPWSIAGPGYFMAHGRVLGNWSPSQTVVHIATSPYVFALYLNTNAKRQFAPHGASPIEWYFETGLYPGFSWSYGSPQVKALVAFPIVSFRIFGQIRFWFSGSLKLQLRKVGGGVLFETIITSAAGWPRDTSFDVETAHPASAGDIFSWWVVNDEDYTRWLNWTAGETTTSIWHPIP